MSSDRDRFNMELNEIRQSPLFDADWYVARYRDLDLMGMDPAEHYVALGARLLRDPGPDFSTEHYLVTNEDVAQAGVNPLWHYITHGRVEGRSTAGAYAHLQPRAPEHPVPLLVETMPAERPARLICFYLPQFHPIAENNEWWGEGFTEWTNVKPALPKFPRHYQPHVPGELGYYDLRDTAVQRRQVELAKLYGIEGFCFYFYWFAGKRLLELPVQNYLADSSLTLPFCLCWANENWSRRWDGRDDDVLIAQDHSPADDTAFIEHIAQYLRDPRYIRIDGKPLLLIYRPGLLPDSKVTTRRWRDWCLANGIGEIYIAYTQSFEAADPADYGCDAAIEFPPNNSAIPLVTKTCRTNRDFAGRIYDWSVLLERSYSYSAKPYTIFRGICPSWDNTARRGINGAILINNSPAKFTQWAANAVREAKSRFPDRDKRLVFVNAWNEWAEGAHLEPDQRYGYAWLEAVRVGLARNADPVQPVNSHCSPALLVDVQHLQGFDEILVHLKDLPERHSLFITTTRDLSEFVQRALEATGRPFSLAIVDDHHDLPVSFMARLAAVREQDCPLFVKLSVVSYQIPAEQLAFLSPDFLERSVGRFAAEPALGMLCPDSELVGPMATMSPALEDLCARLGLGGDIVREADRWRGGVFMARTEALAPLCSLAFTRRQLRGTAGAQSEAMESVVLQGAAMSVLAAGKRVAGASSASVAGKKPRVVLVSHDAHPHGAQLLALNMARSFGHLGFDVDLLVLGPGPLMDRFREVASVHELDAGLPNSRVVRLLAALRDAGAAFVIANTTVSGSIVQMLKQAGFQVVSLIHELPGVLNSYKLQDQAQAIAAHADSVVFPAQIVQQGFEDFIGKPLAQALVRPQGLYLRSPYHADSARASARRNVRQRLGLSPDARIILCAGYADHRKGLDLFVNSCCEVMARDRHAVAVWVGHLDHAFHAQATLRVMDAGLQERFVFTGLLEQPQEYFAAADVYALTSREDPFPSVVMEALDCRVPVVAFTGVGGFEELLQRGCGVLVPAFETSRMADAIVNLLRDPEAAARLGQCGQDIIEQEFSFRHYLYDLAELGGDPIPKVSVVVPNYNYARYIAERLISVHEQTAPIYELIILDDASTDSSVEVIEQFIEQCQIPCRLVASKTNSGSVFKQWRRGVEMARGELVWIAEADDLCEPEFLARVLPAFADPDVVLSYSQSRQMDGDGAILCEHYLDYVADIDPQRWVQPYTASGRDEIADALFVKNTIPNVSAVVFRRKALLDVLVEHEKEIFSYRNAGDWVVYLRLLESGKVSFCPLSLNNHRRHASSVTVGNFNLQQLLEIVQVQVQTIQRHKLGSEAERKANSYAQKLYEQFGLGTSEAPEFSAHPEMEKLLRQNQRRPKKSSSEQSKPR